MDFIDNNLNLTKRANYDITGLFIAYAYSKGLHESAQPGSLAGPPFVLPESSSSLHHIRQSSR